MTLFLSLGSYSVNISGVQRHLLSFHVMSQNRVQSGFSTSPHCVPKQLLSVLGLQRKQKIWSLLLRTNKVAMEQRAHIWKRQAVPGSCRRTEVTGYCRARGEEWKECNLVKATVMVFKMQRTFLCSVWLGRIIEILFHGCRVKQEWTLLCPVVTEFSYCYELKCVPLKFRCWSLDC